MAASTEEPLVSERFPKLLFYDGDCSFCARWVERVMVADTAHRIRFSKLQGQAFKQVAARHPELDKRDTVVLLQLRPDGREGFYTRSTAIRKTIYGLPAFRFFSFVLHIVPTPVADLGYRIVANLREPLFGFWADQRPKLEENREVFLD